jgi:hypothetical protein
MKYMILLFCLLPLCALTQDCHLIRETDPYTKETKMSTGFISLQGASVSIDADSREIDLFFTLTGIDKCYDNNSTAAVYFEGTKSKMSYRNSGTMNCEGFFHIIFKNATATNTLLQKITTQKITSIIFSAGNKKETTIKISPEQQPVLMAMAACLVNEAKMLVK